MSFYPRIIPIWNTLPDYDYDYIVNAPRVFIHCFIRAASMAASFNLWNDRYVFVLSHDDVTYAKPYVILGFPGGFEYKMHSDLAI